jgi:hypothetical protein
VGTVTRANVEGNIVQTSGTASLAAVTTLNVEQNGPTPNTDPIWVGFSGNNVHDSGHTILGGNFGGPHRVFAQDAGVGASVGWNQMGGGQRDMALMNNDPGTSVRGFTLEQRTAGGITQLARFDGTGVRLLGQYPIQFRRYSPIDSALEYVDTEFDCADWHPCVASIRVLNGDIDESYTTTATTSAAKDIFHAYFVNNGSGLWRLKASFKTQLDKEETCHVVGMFVHRSLSLQDPSVPSLII